MAAAGDEQGGKGWVGRGQFSPEENWVGGGKDRNSLEKDAGFDLSGWVEFQLIWLS